MNTVTGQYETEISSEMIKAGVDAYLDWDSTDEWSLDKFVVSLYQAMSKANLQQSHEEKQCA